MADGQGWMVEWYRTATGENPIQEFLAGLEGRNKDEAAALLKLVREWGNRLRGPRSDALGEGLFEGEGARLVALVRFWR